MTFKHEKFEDSATMRSLIKVAEQKGWVKNEPLKKTASIESFDLSPTSSLTENVLKLCSGLRKSGMNKYADEIEKNFIVYKRAAEIYDVSKEKGEDLVDAAHPDGSHQLEGVSGDAVVETIVDRHLKMLDVVDKKPTGKTAASIINDVMIVLSQDANVNVLMQKRDSIKPIIQRNLNKIYEVADKESTFSHDSVMNTLGPSRDIYLVLNSPSLDRNKINSLSINFNKYVKKLSPGFLGLNQSSFDSISLNISNIQNSINMMKKIQSQIDEIGEKEEQEKFKKDQETINSDPTSSTEVSNKQTPTYTMNIAGINKAIQDLQSLQSTVPFKNITQQKKNNILSWIKRQSNVFTKMKNVMDSAADKETVTKSLLNEITREFTEFNDAKKQINAL